MAVRMMSGLPARVIQVLTDFLPAELDLIDAEEADGITTPDIPVANYYEWDAQYVAYFPAVTIRTVSSTPFEVWSDGFGQRVDVSHRLDLMFHATIAQEANPSTPQQLQKLMHRYVNGAMRVLALIKEGLQTTGDPTRFVSLVTWTDSATYGPEEPNSDGVLVRTATLPIAIRRIEARV